MYSVKVVQILKKWWPQSFMAETKVCLFQTSCIYLYPWTFIIFFCIYHFTLKFRVRNKRFQVIDKLSISTVISDNLAVQRITKQGRLWRKIETASNKVHTRCEDTIFFIILFFSKKIQDSIFKFKITWTNKDFHLFFGCMVIYYRWYQNVW
jgi:hypothetical protein